MVKFSGFSDQDRGPQRGVSPKGDHINEFNDLFLGRAVTPFYPNKNDTTPPIFNSSPLKNGGWKTTFLLGR